MKTVTQYKEDIKALLKKSSDIDAQCVNENREHTEAELALKNEILDTVDEFSCDSFKSQIICNCNI